MLDAGTVAAPSARQGTLIGVGVGPGGADLVTLQAVRVLRQADRVMAPSLAADAVGRAESIVRQVSPEVTVERLVFDMSGAPGDRQASHRSAAAAIVPYLDAGEQVAFVTLGDPNIYSTFSSLAATVCELRPATEVRTVAGIMAFQDLAARTGTVLLDGTETLRMVTALDGPAALAGGTRRRAPGGHRLQGRPPPARHPRGAVRRRAARRGASSASCWDCPASGWHPPRVAGAAGRLPGDGHRTPGPSRAEMISFVGAGPGAPDLHHVAGRPTPGRRRHRDLGVVARSRSGPRPCPGRAPGSTTPPA